MPQLSEIGKLPTREVFAPARGWFRPPEPSPFNKDNKSEKFPSIDPKRLTFASFADFPRFNEWPRVPKMNEWMGEKKRTIRERLKSYIKLKIGEWR
jgi:hypothetical protein